MIKTKRVTQRAKQQSNPDDQNVQDDQDGEAPTSSTWFPAIVFKWLPAYLDVLADWDTRGEPLPTTASELTRQVPLDGFQTVRITQILRMWGVVDAATQRADGELLRLLIRPQTRRAALAQLARRQYGSALDLLADPRSTKQSMAKVMSKLWHTNAEMIRRGVRFMVDMALAAGLPVTPALMTEYRDGRWRRRTVPHAEASTALRPAPEAEGSASETIETLQEDDALPEALRVALANGGIRVVDARQNPTESAPIMTALEARDGQTGADVVWPDAQNGNHSLQHRETHRVESHGR